MEITKYDLRSLKNREYKDRRDRHEMAKRRTAKVFVFPEGETIIDNLINRRMRPSKVYGALLKDKVHKDLIAHGALPADAPFKMQWSQTAGCSCGCSPGFVVRGCTMGVDIYVDVKE